MTANDLVARINDLRNQSTNVTSQLRQLAKELGDIKLCDHVHEFPRIAMDANRLFGDVLQQWEDAISHDRFVLEDAIEIEDEVKNRGKKKRR